MSETNEQPVATASAEDIATAVAAAVTKAQVAERTRMGGLRRIATAHGVDAAVLAAAEADGTTVEAFALQVADLSAAAAKAAGEKKIEALKADETDAAKAAASSGNEPGELTAEQLADQIIASGQAAGVIPAKE